ncbi:hypothetical protein JW707_05170 [Candidatus Woesearchaeota archaeon]|nr:hypothetical protein [Candidatus Woesearchaeota archaeon]
MAKKKAAVEVQFNWVFVMVAGALILVFFFGIVQKQRELSQARISDSLLTNLESIATGAGVSKGTVQVIALPNIGINFECTEECLCTYSIEQVQKEYKDRVIFSPEIVKASEVMLWTLDWKVPFRVTNFVYATTAKDKYFFVYDNPNSALYNMLNKTIPPEVNAEFVHFSQYKKLQNENYNSAKFIFVDTSAPIPGDLGIDSSFRRVDVTGLYLNSAGDAHFFNKLSSRSLTFERVESSYFGEPAIYGAIFAADSNDYECNMMSALSRMGNILDLYIERTKELDNLNNAGGFCGEGYSVTNLEQLKGVADTAYKDAKQLKFLSSVVSALNSQNEKLLRASCPLLY